MAYIIFIIMFYKLYIYILTPNMDLAVVTSNATFTGNLSS